MTTIKLRYVQSFKDRHGIERNYFRRPGFPRVRLPGLPGSREFMTAYQSALDGAPSASGAVVLRGTMDALIVAYYQSADWKALKPQTQRTYRLMLDKFREAHGHKSALQLQPQHLASILDRMADTPNAANNLLKRLRNVFKVAIERGLVPSNPTLGVRRLKTKRGGHRAWTEDDIAKFEARWGEGTRARLALYLLLYTGQRRGDVVRLGWQHLIKGPQPKIHLIQQKTGTSLLLPLHPALKRELDLLPTTELTFLLTAYGKPMSPAGFTNWFRDCALKAGLPPHSPAHGLRKAAARRLADAGATTHQIAAVTGHASLKEVEHYAKGADQARLADTAIAMLADMGR